MLFQTKKTWTICISTDEVLAYPDKEIMQTPTPYEQREHQLCFFFIQLNRQVSSVRKKSQCAFYVVICLLAPVANETKVILFLKKTKSASPFCLYTSRHLCSLWHFARQHSRHTAPRRGIQKYRQEYLQKSDSSVLRWTPHRVRGDTLGHTAPRRGI